MESPPGESGKMFFSKTFRLVVNRDEWIISPVGDKAIGAKRKDQAGKRVESSLIEEGVRKVSKPLPLRFTVTEIDKNFEIPDSPAMACLNLAKIVFPLTLRKWKQGDAFYPLGMNKKKKLSDFFIDMKFSIPEKENCWLLCSGNQIIWIVGHRIDHRYRITPRTKQILQVEFLSDR